MGIVQVYEIPSERLLSERSQLDQQNEPVISEQRARGFYVETNDDATTEYQIRTAVDPNTGVTIPQPFEAHPSFAYVFVRNVDARPLTRNCSKYWTVIVTYEGLNIGSQTDPVNELPLERWASRQNEELADHDVDGKPILNTAGQPYDPPLTRPRSTWLMIFECNILNLNTAYWSGYLDHISSATFKGFPKYTCMLRSVEATPRVRGTFRYFRLTLQFEFKSNRLKNPATGEWEEWGHVKKVLNAGYYLIEATGPHGADHKKREVIGADGHPSRQPVPISADGQSVVDALANPADVVFNTHRVVEEVDFNTLSSVIPI